MSPMDERELRHELRHAAPDLPASDTLGRAVMARGRALRRRRAMVATAAFALVAASGVTVWATLPRDTQDAIPVQTPSMTPTPTLTPTPSATPSGSTGTPSPTATPTAPTSTKPTPARSSTVATPSGKPTASGAPSTSAAKKWGQTVNAPGSFGDLGGFTLAADAAPGKAKPGWKAGDSALVYCDATGRVTLPALADVEAGRTLMSGQGESASVQGVLRFATEASAQRFLQQVQAGVSACDAAQPTAGTDGASRWVSETSKPSGLGQQALVTGSHNQQFVTGAWTNAPGGDATLWVRQGRTVTFATEGGEFVGPVWSGRPDIAAELRGTVQHALKQL